MNAADRVVISQRVEALKQKYAAPGVQATALLNQMRRDVYTWRVGMLDSALFYMEHGAVVSCEPMQVSA